MRAEEAEDEDIQNNDKINNVSSSWEKDSEDGMRRETGKKRENVKVVSQKMHRLKNV